VCISQNNSILEPAASAREPLLEKAVRPLEKVKHHQQDVWLDEQLKHYQRRVLVALCVILIDINEHNVVFYLTTYKTERCVHLKWRKTQGEANMPEGKLEVSERLRSEPRNLQRILQATTELLERDGFRRISIEAIAAAAGVSKVTLYRWWPNKSALVMHAFLTTMMPIFPPPDTGSVRDDLRQHLSQIAAAYRGRSGPVIAALIAEAQFDPDLARALRASFLKLRQDPIETILRRGIQRGELRSDIDMQITLETLYATIDSRLLIAIEALDEDFIFTLIDQVLNGIGVNTEEASLFDIET
jgi:AcrR family transcriptional regulator